jgi:PTS system nitrogen regulatory IIA component
MDHSCFDSEAAATTLGLPLVTLPVSATTSAEAAIRFLLAQARSNAALPHELADRLVQSALWREQLGFTAVGDGLALPHPKVEHLPRQTGVPGQAPAGVDWPSSDSEPVRLLCLLLLWPRGSEAVQFRQAVWSCLRGHWRPEGSGD